MSKKLTFSKHCFTKLADVGMSMYFLAGKKKKKERS